MPPVRPVAEIFLYRGEYFTVSNGVFNFYFLSLLLSEILGGHKFTLGGPTSPGRFLAGHFCTQSEYFTLSNCVFNFYILALVVSEIFRGSQIYVREHCVPCTPPSGKFLYLKRARYCV